MGEVRQAGNRSANTRDGERQELAAVLASPTFARAQRLIKLLEYICEKHFQGQDDQLCEYGIATEVLGRPADFDPTEDAIARVEIHRLRKKLRDYYAAEGSRQPLKIIIPPGMYAPVFLQEGTAPASAAGNEPMVVPDPVDCNLQQIDPGETAAGAKTSAGDPGPALAAPPHARRIWLRAGALAVLGLAAVAVAAWRSGTTLATVEQPRPAMPAAVSGPDRVIRVIAGYDRQYIDHNGHTWQADHFFEGGGLPGGPFRQFIARTSDPLLYQSGRIGMTAYSIPLKPGNYELKLHFVEPVYGPGLETGGGENSRVFDILANGKLLVDGFDIVSDAGGPQIADVRVFKDVQPGPDGFLRIGFHARREQPIISAIEVQPAEPHHMNPIRIVTQGNSVTDSQGQLWLADTYYLGGQNSNHWKSVSGTADADLFNNERYGHFSYAIPAAPGSYTVNLYFAETYWGDENQGGPGTGQRQFDVYCNGMALIRGLDILREAGPNRALIKHFRGLRPTAQGKLNLEFVPVTNYASAFAIEVLDEGR
jgi:hypothetical protein